MGSNFSSFSVRAFSVREGKAMGLTEGTMRGKKYISPFPGVRVHRDESSQSLKPAERTLRDAQNYLPRMKDNHIFSHTTALMIYGCPIFSSSDLHVSVPSTSWAPSCKGVVGHRYKTQLVEVGVFNGLPVVAPHTALLQSALFLPLKELVVAIDHLVCPSYGDSGALVEPQALQQYCVSTSTRGVRRAREAIGLSRVGAESRMETLLRLILAKHGLSDLFELQVEVHDRRGFIGRFDLVCRELKLILEYDGEQHRTERQQYIKDLLRLERVRDAGWRVLRFHYEQVLWEPDLIVQKVRAAMRRRIPLED